MDIRAFTELREAGPQGSGSVGVTGDDSSSNAGTYAMFVLLGVAVGVVGTVMVQPMLGQLKTAPSQTKALPPANKGSGWYVLLIDQLKEHGKDSNGQWKGRIKAYEGPFQDRSDAQRVAKIQREMGWSGANAKASVNRLTKAPW